MTWSNRLDYHKELCEKLHNIYEKKNADYGGSVTDTFEKYGMISFLVRLTDKLNRASNLSMNKTRKVADERLEDTLLDLANYALLALVELKDVENKVFEEDGKWNE